MSNKFLNNDLDIASILTATYNEAGGAVTPPIVQTSLFTFDDYDDFEGRMTGLTDKDIYTRIQNPTVRAFEQMMAKIESGEEAVGFASGMAAISSTIMAFVKPGDRIVCVEHVYPDSYKFFERILKKFGIEISYHSVFEFENNADFFKGVKLAYL
ncbi:MAG: PLP-dependent transferase, partial [Rhizobiales bacterium]|nr:PLP-dependent transferase [Hyphomicrobiales bacterium]